MSPRLTFYLIAAQPRPISGGSESLWRETATWLCQRGHRVFVSDAAGPEPGWAAAGIQIRVRQVRWQPLWERAVGKILRQEFDPVMEEVRAVQRAKPDLVVLSQPGFREGVPWATHLREANIPYVLLAHNIHPQLWVSAISAPEIAAAYRGARGAFFAADSIRFLLEDMIGEEVPGAEVVRNPFKVSYRPNLPWPSEADGFKLALVGRLDPSSKGQDLAIRVLGQQKWKNRPLSLDFYGEGALRGCLEALAARVGVNSVRFAGSTNDIETVWKSHHALLMPSRFEGLPLALVEAMLSQRVPITTAVGGIPEAVVDGVTGFLAPAPTLELIDASLERAWARRDEWRVIGTAAGERIREIIPEHPITIFGERLERLAG